MKTLPYYGGKNIAGDINGWIMEILSQEDEKLYIEPFAGMLGILTARQPVQTEIVNDVNSWVYNYWKAIRDEPEELGRLIDATPRSRELFAECAEYQMSKMARNERADGVRDAWRFFVICFWSVHHGCRATPGQFSVTYSSKKRSPKYTSDNIRILNQRIKGVTIENRDALYIIERSIDEPQSVVYCDPPYKSADTSPYGKWHLDFEKFMDLCSAHKGRVAISGYNDDYAPLLNRGWFESDLTVLSAATSPGGYLQERVEKLWTNFEPKLKKQGDMFSVGLNVE